VSATVLGVPVRRWIAFFAIAVGVVAVDQLTKAYVVANYPLDQPVQVIGDWLRIWYIHNSGAVLGMFAHQAGLFAVATVAILGVIVWFHARSAASGGWIATVALALLFGGAIGNLIDRLRLDHVVDFVDMGIGGWRFYTYNVADAAVSTAIVLLLVLALVPGIARRFGGTAEDGSGEPGADATATGPADGPGPESVGGGPGAGR
jgi:signal peptidase II